MGIIRRRSHYKDIGIKLRVTSLAGFWIEVITGFIKTHSLSIAIARTCNGSSLTHTLQFIASAFVVITLSSCDILGHVDANVPAPEEFDSLMQQALASYAAKQYGSSDVSYSLLRDAPTQVGLAYPKFYVWVEVRNKGKLVENGAARLAAIDKAAFEVTHFVTRDEILTNSKAIESVFPAALCPKILSRARRSLTDANTALHGVSLMIYPTTCWYTSHCMHVHAEYT
jgi:hypothetical protein